LNSKENEYYKLECRSVPYLTTSISSNAQSYVKLWCPAGCKNQTQNVVYGSNNAYADHSSICRAAIHSGVIDDDGGNFIMSTNIDCQFYTGSLQNDV